METLEVIQSVIAGLLLIVWPTLMWFSDRVYYWSMLWCSVIAVIVAIPTHYVICVLMYVVSPFTKHKPIWSLKIRKNEQN